MAENNLKGLRVTILASDGFEEMELVAPREALDEAGAETELLAPGTGTIYGMKHHDKAEKVNIDVRIEDATPADLQRRCPAGGKQRSGICSRDRPQRQTDGHYLSCALVADVRRSRKDSNANELPHHPGRRPKRGRQMGRPRGRPRSELGNQQAA